MSLTPIFDAVLADSDCDIFLAGNIFPRPVTDPFALQLAKVLAFDWRAAPWRDTAGKKSDWTLRA